MMEGKTPILLSSSLPRSIIGIRRSLRSLRLALSAERSSHRRRLLLQHHGHCCILLEVCLPGRFQLSPLSKAHYFLLFCFFSPNLSSCFTRKYNCLMVRFSNEQYAHRRTYADTIVFLDLVRRLATTITTYPANTFCGARGAPTRTGSSRPQLLGPLRQRFSGSPPAPKNAQSVVVVFVVYTVSSRGYR